MGTTREWGYREYDDDLTPGKDGASNLLFDDGGRLVAHAPFFKSDAESDTDLGDIATLPTDIDESKDSNVTRLVVAAGALAALAAIGGGVKLWQRCRSIRLEASKGADAITDAQEELGASLGIDFTAQDDLIDEIDVLVEAAPNRSVEERLSDLPVDPVDDEFHEALQPGRQSNNA